MIKILTLVLLSITLSILLFNSCDMRCATAETFCYDSCMKTYGKNLPPHTKIIAKVREQKNNHITCDCYTVKNDNE